MTKMGSIVGDRIDYNGVGVLRGQQHTYPAKLDLSRGGEWSSENKKSRQILPKSRNLAQPTNGSQSLRFCVYRSHICFSIKSLHFFISGSDFKMPVSSSR